MNESKNTNNNSEKINNLCLKLPDTFLEKFRASKALKILIERERGNIIRLRGIYGQLVIISYVVLPARALMLIIELM